MHVHEAHSGDLAVVGRESCKLDVSRIRIERAASTNVEHLDEVLEADGRVRFSRLVSGFFSSHGLRYQCLKD